MTKDDFRKLFIRALNLAAENAEARLAKSIPHSFEIALYAPGSPGRTLSIDEALDRIYLGGDRFYRIIDVAVTGLRPGGSVVFVRVSGHPTTEYGKTWDPAKLGPFKQILAEQIEDHGPRVGRSAHG
jgi:hypothetical protein